MGQDNPIVCCLKCLRLKYVGGDWVKVDKDIVKIISKSLRNGFCDFCADELYDELELDKAVLQAPRSEERLVAV